MWAAKATAQPNTRASPRRTSSARSDRHASPAAASSAPVTGHRPGGWRSSTAREQGRQHHRQPGDEAGVGRGGVLEPDRLEAVAGEQGQPDRRPRRQQARLALAPGGQPRPDGGQQQGRGQEPVGDEGERRDLGDRVPHQHEGRPPDGGDPHHGQLPPVGADPPPGGDHDDLLLDRTRPDDPTTGRGQAGGRLWGRREWGRGRRGRARGGRRVPGAARRCRRPGLDQADPGAGLDGRPGRHPHRRGHPLVRHRPGRRPGAAGHDGAAGPARDGQRRADPGDRHLRHRAGPGDRRLPAGVRGWHPPGWPTPPGSRPWLRRAPGPCRRRRPRPRRPLRPTGTLGRLGGQNLPFLLEHRLAQPGPRPPAPAPGRAPPSTGTAPPRPAGAGTAPPDPRARTAAAPAAPSPADTRVATPRDPTAARWGGGGGGG